MFTYEHYKSLCKTAYEILFKSKQVFSHYHGHTVTTYIYIFTHTVKNFNYVRYAKLRDIARSSKMEISYISIA